MKTSNFFDLRVLSGILPLLSGSQNTGSPSSKYEHRRASALLRNIQKKIRIIEIKTYKTATDKSAHGPHRRDVTHILSKVSCFLLKSFHFRRLQKRLVFFPIQILIFWMLHNNADASYARRCSYLELGLPVVRNVITSRCLSLFRGDKRKKRIRRVKFPLLRTYSSSSTWKWPEIPAQIIVSV